MATIEDLLKYHLVTVGENPRPKGQPDPNAVRRDVRVAVRAKSKTHNP